MDYEQDEKGAFRMKTFLFLDDWMIEATRDVVRRWPQARPVDVPPFTEANNYGSVIYDPLVQKYRMWFGRFLTGKIPAEKNEVWLDAPFMKGFFHAESEDGYHFESKPHGGPTDARFPGAGHSLKLPPRPGGWPHKVQMFHRPFLDERETDDAMRYKAPSADGPIFTSPDGITWTPQEQMQWIKPLDSDTFLSMIFNPLTERYQFFCRPGNLDRRMATIESEDLRIFTERRVILQSDVLDPPLHQVYGLVPFWYEDLFIGLFWDNFVPNTEKAEDVNLGGRLKMGGIVDTSLAYSYDGRHWLRGPRTPLLPRDEMPNFGWAGHYATSVVMGPDNVLRIYSRASRLEHGDVDGQRQMFERGEGEGAMRVYTMRKDGFAYLEPIGSWAFVQTRGLVPQAADLRINFRAPFGTVKVQLTGEDAKPLSGFSFDDCIPLTGDELEAPVRWKEKSLEEVIGKWLRLEFEFYQAELYAYRWHCHVHYALDEKERF